MAGLAELGDRLLVVFDGECGLCNRTVRWMARRDRRDRLRFAPSSAPEIAGLLARHGIALPVVRVAKSNSDFGAESGASTILVFRNLGAPVEEMLVRSNAVLACLRVLPQPWPAFAGALRAVPRSVRDVGYRLVARWRYRIWGRYESCPLPAPEERRHFL